MSAIKKDLEGYASYLEAKLDKLSHSAPRKDEYEFILNKIAVLEEKIGNLTKVVKLVQKYTEAQEHNSINKEDSVNTLLLKRIVIVTILIGELREKGKWKIWNTRASRR